jgi:hypothetical protein
MSMSAPVRKLALVAHVTGSVGWLGAVAVSLALGITGLTSTDGRLVQAAYLSMPAIGWSVLVPLSLLSLATGLIQALGTKWGLLRHYWVVTKLVMNLFATTVLLLYMQTLSVLADAARAWTGDDPGPMRSPSPVLHAGAALVLLSVAAVLSVYKPRGQTGYGQARAQFRSIEGSLSHADRSC